jgi:hypothetical protein
MQFPAFSHLYLRYSITDETEHNLLEPSVIFSDSFRIGQVCERGSLVKPCAEDYTEELYIKNPARRSKANRIQGITLQENTWILI